MQPSEQVPFDPEQSGGAEVPGLPDPLVIRQFYLGCLSVASYLVGDRATGRAIAVDPRRDIDELVQAAASERVEIEMVVETHFHADFLSGHLELAAATGAKVGFGAAGSTEFDSVALSDGDVIDLGGVQVEIWETPGHTPESISLIVSPSPGADPVAALTGDTLFIGDVGRPDLLVAADVPAEELGAKLYHSVKRLSSLPGSTLVLPAHGRGSACGKALSSDTVSTIGDQLESNYALAPLTPEQFVDLVTEGQPTAPGYFGYDARLNRSERALLDEHEQLRVFGLDELDDAVAAGAAVIDVRPITDFVAGHLAGSIGVNLDGRFAEQVGSVITPGVPIVLVGDERSAQQARVRLARIGFDDVIAVLPDAEAVILERPERARRLSRLTAAEFDRQRELIGTGLQFLDVRNPAEVEAAPMPGAQNMPLARIRDQADSLDPQRATVVVCAGGARSAIAASLLESLGFTDVSDVLGGATALGITEACSTRPR